MAAPIDRDPTAGPDPTLAPRESAPPEGLRGHASPQRAPAPAGSLPIPTPSPCTWCGAPTRDFAVSSIRVHLPAIRTAHLLAGLSVDLRHPRLAMAIEGVLIPAQPHSSFLISSFSHDAPVVRRAPGRNAPRQVASRLQQSYSPLLALISS
jgi:hypothetical protein